jgi:hypothetical protein
VHRRLDRAGLGPPVLLVEGLGLLSEAVEAQGIELLGIRECFFVPADAVGGDFDGDARGKDLAVRERYRFENLPGKGGF